MNVKHEHNGSINLRKKNQIRSIQSKQTSIDKNKKQTVIIINDMNFFGNTLQINNNGIKINGKTVVSNLSDLPAINITVNGNLDSLDVDVCDMVNVIGNVKTIKTLSGDIQCKDVTGDVQSTSGDIECKNVAGNVKTISGDIDAEKIKGKCSTVSGDINK